MKIAMVVTARIVFRHRNLGVTLHIGQKIFFLLLFITVIIVNDCYLRLLLMHLIMSNTSQLQFFRLLLYSQICCYMVLLNMAA